jgi:hypothetical protein
VATDLRDGLDEAGARRDVRRDDDARPPFPHQPGHRIDVDAALGDGRCVHHLDAEALPQGQERDLVRDVVVARRQDHVVGLEGDRRERARDGVRRVGREGDVLRSAAEKLGGGGVEAVDRLCAQVGRLIAADLRLEPEVLDRRLEHR